MDINNLIIPSVTPNCFLGIGIVTKQFVPACGFLLIKICENPIAEV